MRFAGVYYGGVSLMQIDESQMCDSPERETCCRLMLSAEDSPARTSATPDCARGSRESEAGCGSTCTESLANYDRATSLSKTSQLCCNGEWETFSGPWPRSGMTRNGLLFQRPQLVHAT